jgi:hypothetical protein
MDSLYFATNYVPPSYKPFLQGYGFRARASIANSLYSRLFLEADDEVASQAISLNIAYEATSSSDWKELE